MASRTELAKRIFDTAHLTGSFLLRSGATSQENFDKYLFEADPTLLKPISEAMTALLPEDFHSLAGLEMGGIPVVTMLSQASGIPALFVRKKAKEYGTCKLAEGGDIEGRKLVIVEDVVTSGGQILLSAQDLRDRGAIIDTVVCVIDREAGGKDKLAEAGLELRPLFTMTELKAAGSG